MPSRSANIAEREIKRYRDRLGRTIGLYLALFAWKAGLDGVVLMREDIQGFFGISNTGSQRIDQDRVNHHPVVQILQALLSRGIRHLPSLSISFKIGLRAVPSFGSVSFSKQNAEAQCRTKSLGWVGPKCAQTETLLVSGRRNADTKRNHQRSCIVYCGMKTPKLRRCLS